MTPQLKKFLLLHCFLFATALISCSKTTGEKGAKEAEGTYTGLMTFFDGNTNLRYDNYIIKVEHRSQEKIRVSC